MPTLTDPLGWFTLDFPDGWESETDDCVTTLRSPVGTVYVCGGRHARGRQRSFGGADFLLRFLRSIGVRVEDSQIEQNQGCGCRIYSFAREDEGAHWRYWSVTDDETALLISYTCAARNIGREEADIKGLVQSIRLFHSAPVH